MQNDYMVSDLIRDLSLTVLTDVYSDRPITIGYCCDMLSWVMARLGDSACWFTILNSMNVVAVASLSGCPCVVLTEGVMMDEAVLVKAKNEEICILSTDKDTFTAAAILAAALRNVNGKGE